jgi:putative addiction module killer protein
MESKSKELLEYITADGKCPFDEWLKSLKDIRARALIRVRLNRIILGNYGDCKSVGDGVSELRIDFGPGYRIYFGQDGAILIILLCAGSKKSQRKDINLAKRYWADYLWRKNE